MTWKNRLEYATACALTLLMLQGCAKGLPVRDFCLLYQPVYTAKQDTEETKKQADGNNAVWQELCPQPGKESAFDKILRETDAGR